MSLSINTGLVAVIVGVIVGVIPKSIAGVITTSSTFNVPALQGRRKDLTEGGHHRFDGLEMLRLIHVGWELKTGIVLLAGALGFPIPKRQAAVIHRQ